jgi:hypothetical protein
VDGIVPTIAQPTRQRWRQLIVDEKLHATSTTT